MLVQFGKNNSSYLAAGELEGITQLVNDFYDVMDSEPEYLTIRNMHPDDLAESRKKLIYFLSGWLGGQRLYSEHYGSISIPFAHKHLVVDSDEKNAWLSCMQKAVEKQPFSDEFKVYIMEQFQFPANRIEQVSQSKS